MGGESAAGQRTAGSKVQVSSHQTLDTRVSGHWPPSLQTTLTYSANTCKHWLILSLACTHILCNAANPLVFTITVPLLSRLEIGTLTQLS